MNKKRILSKSFLWLLYFSFFGKKEREMEEAFSCCTSSSYDDLSYVGQHFLWILERYKLKFPKKDHSWKAFLEVNAKLHLLQRKEDIEEVFDCTVPEADLGQIVLYLAKKKKKSIN